MTARNQLGIVDGHEGVTELGGGCVVTIESGDYRGARAIFLDPKRLGLEHKSVTRTDELAKACTVDHNQQSVQLAALTFSLLSHRRFDKNTCELRKRFDDQRAWHDRMTRKVVDENVV